jgi:DNA-directed RNA polymerase subunit beta'
VAPIVDAGNVIASLGMRVLGRTTAEDVINNATGESHCSEGHVDRREGR